MQTEQRNSLFRLGIASLLGFVATHAVRDVYMGHLFGDLGLYEAATLAFGTAALVFGTGLFLFKRDQIKMLLSDWRTVIILNITTMISWLSYFQALRMVEPAAVNLAFSGVAPIAVTMFGAFGLISQGEQKPGIIEQFVHWALLGCVSAVALVVAGGYSGFTDVDPLTGVAGVALAAFAGFSITAETIYAKRMNISGISPVAIVGVRFLLVTFVAGVMLTGISDPYPGMSAGAIAVQALIFLAILIGPIYLVQAGIALTTPLVSGVVCSIGPIATLILQSAATGISFSPAMLGVTICYAVLAVAAALLSAAHVKQEPAA